MLLLLVLTFIAVSAAGKNKHTKSCSKQITKTKRMFNFSPCVTDNERDQILKNCRQRSILQSCDIGWYRLDAKRCMTATRTLAPFDGAQVIQAQYNQPESMKYNVKKKQSLVKKKKKKVRQN